MPQALNLKLKGLYVSNNELDANPEGALQVADNVVIDFDSLAQSRRGFDRLTYTFPDGDDRATRYAVYQSKLISHYGDDTVAHYDDSTGWIDYSGTYTHPNTDVSRMRFLEANQNLYWNSANGIYKIDAYNSTPRLAGAPKGLDISGATTGASGFMPDDSQVAYRVVWGYKDLNNNLILGAPSQRAVIINSTGGTRNVIVTFTIPEDVTTDYFFQIYRSPASATSTIEPLDEMQLVYEANPTPGEISAGTVSVTDITPDSLKGATLYTSPSQEGIGQSNDQPVFCYDFCTFKNYTFYANVASKQRLSLTIVSVGGSNGIAINDVLTIGGIAYTGKATENIAANEFAVVTGGTPAQNIADTSASLIRVVNRSASNTTINAYYVSGYNDLPGQIVFEERAVGGSTFAATASAHSTAYSPNLPTSGTTVSSANDRYKHGIYISKFEQPEAVPLTNLIFAGNASQDILRIVPLRDSVFILKTDGVYRISGSDLSNFSVELFDSTVRILASDSAVVLANELWCLSDQGVVSISESGVSVRSRPIESQLIELFGDALSLVKHKSFGISYETDRKYILFTVQSDASTYPDQAYVFNVFTNTWTRWIRSQTAGIVNPVDNKLYLGDAVGTSTNIERKSYTYRDFIDELVASPTITAISSDELTFTLDTIEGIEIGDLIFQSSNVNAVITDIDTQFNTVTVNFKPGFAIGVCSVFKGIDCVIEWQPNSAGNPGVIKQFPEIEALFRSTRFYSANFGFASELSQSIEDVEVLGTPNGGFGLFPWGRAPWGGTLKPKALRTYVPATKQLSAQIVFRLSIRNAYSDWKLLGVSLPYNEINFEVTK